MFSVIYRAFIYPEREQHYLQAWKTVATYYVQQCGALGSTLHKTEQGEYIAYSRWTDRNTRDRVWGDQAMTLPDFVSKAVDCIKSCIDTTKPHDEIPMKIVDSVLPEHSYQ